MFAVRLTGICTALSLCVESVGLESPLKRRHWNTDSSPLSERAALEYRFITFVRKGGIGIQIHHLCQKGRHWNTYSSPSEKAALEYLFITLSERATLKYIFITLSERAALEYRSITFVRKGVIGMLLLGRHWNVVTSLGPKDGIGILVSGFVRTFLLSSERAAA